MTCNRAKINESDWSDAANDAADAGVEFLSTPAFRRVSTLISVKTCSQFDA